MAMRRSGRLDEKARRGGTATSDFGTSGRVSHDSSRFYGSRLYGGQTRGGEPELGENEINEDSENRVFCKSSERMDELPDRSVHLMITSPPYNVGKQYDADLTLDEYLAQLRRVFGEVQRVLVSGGRACVNVANVGRRPYIPLQGYIAQVVISLGFLMRGEIIWDKSSSAGVSTAWGSWRSATNPSLRDTHEYILVFSKDSFRRGVKGKNTIGRDEFLEYTKSVWRFPTESAKRIGHPAPFPVELPYRLIQLYSFEGDVVLDPFMGSGTTGIACHICGRQFIGYELDPESFTIAADRIAHVQKNKTMLQFAGGDRDEKEDHEI